jgi:2-C-methyl-D-erythritol 2,4-cyclodiphosphate synthase
MNMRIGHGFDLHRLELGVPMVIGGVRIEHDKGAAGHSDGDVIYHAVTDAILGALGQPDIGQLFPDHDPQWQGADSRVFVAEADRIMRTHGYVIGNLDVTVIAQEPKIGPHKETIEHHLAYLLGCDESQVNVKGKTHEHVDAIGQGNAIACHALVLLRTE